MQENTLIKYTDEAEQLKKRYGSISVSLIMRNLKINENGAQEIYFELLRRQFKEFYAVRQNYKEIS